MSNEVSKGSNMKKIRLNKKQLQNTVTHLNSRYRNVLAKIRRVVVKKVFFLYKINLRVNYFMK